MPPEVKAAARAHTLEGIERLAYWMRSEEASASVAATKELLDRGWGKAAAAEEDRDALKSLRPLEGVSAEELIAAIAKRDA